MSYDGPSLSEFLAELRARRPLAEVVLFRVALPAPLARDGARPPVTALAIARYVDTGNPLRDRGYYVLSLTEAGESVGDTWHEHLDDAFGYVEADFGLHRADWKAVGSGSAVTPRVERYVRERFGALEADLVLDALAEWRIPYEDEPPGERLMAAVVFAADGRLDGVDAGFRLAETDWRDLLVAGDLAHEGWEAVMTARLGPPTP